MKKIFLAILLASVGLGAGAQRPIGGHGGDRGRGGFSLDKSNDSLLTQMIATEVPKFEKHVFTDERTGVSLPYFLFTPKGHDASESLPLVLFMGDASTTGTDTQRPLTQGWGALIWATEAEQERHPAYVLVPAYTAQAVDDDWNTSAEVETTISLLESICQRYNVDRSRLYTTGQSMGGMMSFYFNITHPHLFAASLFVGSQWDTTKMSPFIGNKFFYVVGAGDEKASKGMAELEAVLARQGALWTKGGWSAKLPADVQNDSVKALIGEGGSIHFISFAKGSVLSETGHGMEHMASFDFAYRLGAVRDWLFSQRLEGFAAPTAPLVFANDGDWHGTEITPLMAIKKAIDKDAYAAVFSLSADGETLASTHGNTAVETSLTDALALAKGRIRIAIRVSSKAEAAALEEKVAAGAMLLPTVSLDQKDWKKKLKAWIAEGAEFVELTFSKNEAQLAQALKWTDGKVKVVVNTTDASLAAGHIDAGRGAAPQQVWGTLADMGAAGVVTNQIKPMLRWLQSR